MSTNTPSDDLVLECVVFDTVDDADRDVFIDAARAVTDWVSAQPGFVDRELYEVGDGRWIDTVRWASLDDAHAAAQLIGSVETLGAFMSMIDGPTIQMMHGHPVGAGTS